MVHMDFYEAMRWVRQGRRVARDAWRQPDPEPDVPGPVAIRAWHPVAYTAYFPLDDGGRPDLERGMLVQEMPDGDITIIFSVPFSDITADDWHVMSR